MKKKFLAVLLCTVLCISLMACSEQRKEYPFANEEQKQTLKGVGILAVEAEGKVYHWSDEKKIIISAINPDTGDYGIVREFSDIDQDYKIVYEKGWRGLADATYFDSNYTRMPASIYKYTVNTGDVENPENRILLRAPDKDGKIGIVENQANHVGWVDEAGNFTDVSEVVAGSSNTPHAVVEHSLPRFGANDDFYFYDKSTENYYKLPAGILSKDNLEVVSEDEYNTGDWNRALNVDESTYLGHALEDRELVALQDNLRNSICILRRSQPYPKVVKDLLPQDYPDGNYGNPVISPDKTRVAFIFRKRRSAGEEIQDPKIQLVPIEGGEPVKINTSYQIQTEGAKGFIDCFMDWR